MGIHYTCRCGANLNLPTSSAGKQARCRSCQAVFTVPGPDYDPDAQSIPLEESEQARKTSGSLPDKYAPRYSEELGCWVSTGYSNEEYMPRSDSSPPLPMKIVGDEGEPARQATETTPAGGPEPSAEPLGRRRPPDGRPIEEATDRDGVIPPTRPFWHDLAASFTFLLDAGNFITFFLIVGINMGGEMFSFAPSFLAVLGYIIILCLLGPFYISVIVETAAGNDDLPHVWFNNTLDDLIMPLLCFVGTWVAVLLPAGTLYYQMCADQQQIDWIPIYVLAAAGAFFWPVTVLAVAIGGSFRGLWPHKILLTALAAPPAYLAVWLVLLVTAAICAIPNTSSFNNAIMPLTRILAPNKVVILLALLRSVLGVYCAIIAMRAIGLYYRHYKHRFPWVAE